MNHTADESVREQDVALATGLRARVLQWGDPARGHTVVLLHGFLDLAWGFLALLRQPGGLAERYHVLAPDLRGHGDSGWVGAGGYYHFPDYVADLHCLLAQVPVAPRVSLVGHSMGGSVAAYYAGSYPQRVHRLALLEGTGPPESSEEAPDRIPTWVEGWQKARSRPQRGYATVEEAALQLRRYDPLLGEALALELARRGTRLEGGLLRFKHDPLHLTRGPLPFKSDYAARFFARVACPVLLVEGERSVFRLPPAEAERRHRHFRDARELLLPGAGHMLQRHQPQLLSNALCEFLGP